MLHTIVLYNLYTHDVPLSVSNMWLLHIPVSDVDVFSFLQIIARLKIVHHFRSFEWFVTFLDGVFSAASALCDTHEFLCKMMGKIRKPHQKKTSKRSSKNKIQIYPDVQNCGLPKPPNKIQLFTSSCRVAVSCDQGVARCGCSLARKIICENMGRF